jgi:20S proteasome alpha/beta subunit
MVNMSFIVGFKTENYVLVAGDRRETYVDGSGYKDTSTKVHKLGDYIYGVSGSTELSNLFTIAISKIIDSIRQKRTIREYRREK